MTNFSDELNSALDGRFSDAETYFVMCHFARRSGRSHAYRKGAAGF